MLMDDFIFYRKKLYKMLFRKRRYKKTRNEDHAIGLYLNEKYKDTLLHFDTRKIFFDNT